MKKVLLAWLAAPLVAAAAPVPVGEFAWKAPITAPAESGLYRIELPAQVLGHSRTRGLADLRIVDDRGETVPFAIVRTPPAAHERATRVNVYPLSRGQPPRARQGSRAMRVKVQASGQQDALWVQFDSSAAAPAESFPSVIVDTRTQEDAVRGIRLDADLPANTPVRIRAFASADLADWTELAVRGALYRFTGDSALENRELSFATATVLKDRYLRLDWAPAGGVAVRGAELLARKEAAPARAVLRLPVGTSADNGLEWQLPNAAQPAALVLEAGGPEMLLPLRVMARQDPNQPWRQIGQGVVYQGKEGSGPSIEATVPLPLQPRYVRVQPLREASMGALAARLEFEPVQVVLHAARQPLQVLVGRDNATRSDVPEENLKVALGTRTWATLPAAQVGAVEANPANNAGRPAWLPAWAPDRLSTTNVLWLVLGLGVAVLAVVAFKLVGQIKPLPGGES